MPASEQYLWHPSVERLVESSAHAFGADRVIAVMLTGMGDDGAQAMCAIRRAGGLTIAQDEATSVVWGMPGELVKRGGANLVLPAERIANQLVSWLSAGERDKKEAHYGFGQK
jgi:two-component system, chemotaxis family, protein-glutamate methylesterase/glutaminase